MSSVVSKNYQIGADGTATNNFTIRQPATPDGTVRIANGNTGSTTDLVTLTSAGNATVVGSVTASSFSGAGTGLTGVVQTTGNQAIAGVKTFSNTVGFGTASPANQVTIESNGGQLRVRNTTTRYRSDLGVNTAGAAELNSYDDTGAVYMPLRFAGRSLEFQTGAGSVVERARINDTGQQYSVIPGGSTLYPEFKCRAWVNFNGTGTVAIRASGNVSSITDNGVGDYTVNFTAAMPDTYYGLSAWARASVTFFYWVSARVVDTKTTSAIRISVISNRDGNTDDVSEVDVAIFR